MLNRSIEFKKRFVAETCLFMLLVLGLALNLNAQEKDVDPFKEKSGESSWGSDDENKSDKWSGQAVSSIKVRRSLPADLTARQSSLENPSTGLITWPRIWN